jgi:hypothetical protein
MANRRSIPDPTPVPDAPAPLHPLEECLLQANAGYHRFLNEPGQFAYVKELGRTVRCLAQCIAQVEGLTDDEFEEGELPDD